MDKQIIIDGVDVSECGNWCSLKYCEGFRCVKWNILKASQEAKQLDQLKADNKHLNDLLNQALKELEEMREAVEKIKELIQKEIADCEHCDDCTNCEYNCCTKQILQICDEVNDDNA